MSALISYRGELCALFSQVFPPRAAFGVDQIPDLTGRVVIVTGQSLHFELAYELIEDWSLSASQGGTRA